MFGADSSTIFINSLNQSKSFNGSFKLSDSKSSHNQSKSSHNQSNQNHTPNASYIESLSGSPQKETKKTRKKNVQEIYTAWLKRDETLTACDLRKDNTDLPKEDRVAKFDFSKQLIPSLTQVCY